MHKAARQDIMKSSMKCSGNWPANRHATDPFMFAPSKVFDAASQSKSKPISSCATNSETVFQSSISDMEKAN